MRPDRPAERSPRVLGQTFLLPILGLSLFCNLELPPGCSLAAEASSAKVRKVDFNREVRPLLSKNCFACHGQDEAKRAKGLRLDRREAAVSPLKSGELAIVPGDPDASELIVRVLEEDETLRMPPKKHGIGSLRPRSMS